MEVFQRVDRGDASEELVAQARGACLGCEQKPFCDTGREKIADQLWQNGVEHLFVGAGRVDPGEATAAVELGVPTFRFNLSRLPTAPEERLKFIRQGVRAEQLTITSRTPHNAVIIARRYEELLNSRAPDVMQRLREALKDDDQRDMAVRHIVLPLCQQADFENFSNRVRSLTKGADNKRFNPDLHDYETNAATVALYLDEVCGMSRLGFTRPSRVAINHSTTDIGRLLEKYDEIVNPGTIRQIIITNVRNPATALMKYSARLQAIREKGELSEKAARREALSLTETAPKLQKRKSPANRSPVAQSGTSEVEDSQATRRAELARIFGDDPDLTPGDIDHFTRYADGVAQVGVYKNRLAEFRQWAVEATTSADTIPHVPDSFLRECAIQSGIGSYDQIIRAHTTRKLQMRFYARKTPYKPQERIPIETWMLHRVAALYPIEEIDQAAENLYMLLGRGVLGRAVAELEELQDPAIHVSLDKLSEPRNRRYVTFSKALVHMNTAQRVMLAHCFGLEDLLYGRTFGEEAVGRYAQSVGQKWLSEQGLLVPSNTLLKEKGRGSHVPFSTIRQDIIEMIFANPTANADVVAESYRKPIVLFTTVVSGEAANLSLRATEGNGFGTLGLSADQRLWIEQVIQSAYRPSEREHGAQSVFCLQNGNLVIAMTPTGFHRITLSPSFYGPGVEDVHRAVAAQVMGLARPLYGQDLDLLVRNRVAGGKNLVAYVQKSILPLLPEWESPKNLREMLHVSDETLHSILSRARPEQVWLYKNRILAVKKGFVQAAV